MSALSAFLRWFSQHLYTTLAWSYDLVAWLVSGGQWRRWQQPGIEGLPPGRVLELGPGPGHALCDLARSGRHAVGVDLSRQMVRQAARRLRRAGLPQRLARGRSQALPFASGGFDSALATFPSEYILDPETLREVARVLRPQGAWIVIPSARITGGGVIDRVLKRWTEWLHQTGPVGTAFVESFRAAGFEARIESVPLERADVYRLVATRPPAVPS